MNRQYILLEFKCAFLLTSPSRGCKIGDGNSLLTLAGVEAASFFGTVITMANDSHKPLGGQLLAESERSAFYAWAHAHGFTRLNSSCEDLAEELWRDREGKVMSAGRIVSEHADWRVPPGEEVTESRRKPMVPPFTSVNRVEWSRLLPTVTLAMIMIGAVQLVIDSHHAAALTPSNQSASPLVESGDRTNLGLTVTTLSNQFQIRWNRESQAILASDHGVMKITVNGITEAVPFDPAQLRDGYLAYGPKTSDVSIRLEVTGQDGAMTSESVRSVTIP